jgi:hypothetical protein
MKFRMDKIVRELVEKMCEWTHLERDPDFVNRDRTFADVLIQMEIEGDAMRFIDVRGRIAWKVTPKLRKYFMDLQLDAEADLEDF